MTGERPTSPPPTAAPAPASTTASPPPTAAPVPASTNAPSPSKAPSASAPIPTLEATPALAATVTATLPAATSSFTTPPPIPGPTLKVTSTPTRLPMPPPSPEPSPERLDWGDIEDSEDEEDDICGEGTDSANPGHAEDEVMPLHKPSAAGSMAAFTAASDLGGGLCKDTMKDVSPVWNLRSAAGQSKAPAKLKSILVVPPGHQSPVRGHQSRSDRRSTPTDHRDASPPWTEVKSRRRMQGNSFPSSSGHSRLVPQRSVAGERPRQLSPAYKEAFRGKCFRCLASDHQLAQCRDPPRCLTCRRSGHLARRCPERTKRPIQSRLTFPPSNIQSRLTFPLPNIHSRLTFPPFPTSSPRAVSADRSPSMALVPGAPSQRPVEGNAVIAVEGAMAAELRRLRCTGVVFTATDRNYTPEPMELQHALNKQLRIPLHNISVSKHKPEDFFARFDHPDQAEQVVRKGIIDVGGTGFITQPWRETSYARPCDWYFHCKVFIERLPLHAWCEDGVRQALGDHCVFDYIEPISFTQENTEVLQCWVWMWSPDQLPRSKLTTIFPEGAGRSRPGVTAVPPTGGMVNLIIHLDRYFDWTPPPASRTPSSRASGLPSSSSWDPEERPFPFYQEFVWYPGVLDGRLPRTGLPRLHNNCREGPSARRDRDPDDEEHRGPRRHWTEQISARGRPADDLPRGRGLADRYRSRSPVQQGRRHGAAWERDHTLESRGRSGTRSPPTPTRFREPACREDEGWERRRSRSPSRLRPHMDGWDGPSAATQPHLRQFPDPIIDFIDSLCQDSVLREGFPSGAVHDPMVHEVACALQRQLTYSPSTSPPGDERYLNSPPYVPVSDLWAGRGTAEAVGHARPTQLGQQTQLGHHEQLGHGDQIVVEELTEQVHSMDIDGPTPGGDGAANEAREHFFASVFSEVQPAALAAPPESVVDKPALTPQVQEKRQSKRLLARPSSVPVSRRATHRLMRQLDIVEQGQAIGDEAVAQYERTYQGRMPRKTVAALAAVTRVASGVVMAASAALAADAAVAQVEAN